VRIEPSPGGGAALIGLDAFLHEILRQIPFAAHTDDNLAAEARLYSAPAPSEEEKFLGEWAEFVEPGLRHLFASSLETVKTDLGNVISHQQDDRREFSLNITAGHTDAWLNALNQARLVLTASHAFTEDDMDAGVPTELNSQRDLALFQVHFYGYIQECLLQIMEGGE
jgi:hypothetical protein